jgi:hypothetical protein
MLKPWRWDKPVHWADLVRSSLILGHTGDCSYSTNMKMREWLSQRIESGEIIQIKRGLYRLARQPEETPTIETVG